MGGLGPGLLRLNVGKALSQAVLKSLILPRIEAAVNHCCGMLAAALEFSQNQAKVSQPKPQRVPRPVPGCCLTVAPGSLLRSRVLYPFFMMC